MASEKQTDERAGFVPLNGRFQALKRNLGLEKTQSLCCLLLLTDLPTGLLFPKSPPKLSTFLEINTGYLLVFITTTCVRTCKTAMEFLAIVESNESFEALFFLTGRTECAKIVNRSIDGSGEQLSE